MLIRSTRIARLAAVSLISILALASPAAAQVVCGSGTLLAKDGRTCVLDPQSTEVQALTSAAFAAGSEAAIREYDRDGDGTPDAEDGCPDDPAKTKKGGKRACGCGVPDTLWPTCDKFCPGDCGGPERGACKGNRCVCKAGYWGLDCAQDNCQSNCMGRGICQERDSNIPGSKNVCKCLAGFSGPACEFWALGVSCSDASAKYAGYAPADPKCQCKAEWTHSGQTICGASCANPDSDANGPWCYTTATCGGLNYAYCAPR